MSLILDALRKMEEDRKSRRGDALDIRPEVLRYRAALKKPQQGKPYLLATIALVLVAAGLGAGIFLKGSGGESSQATPPAAPAVQAAAAPTAQTAAIQEAQAAAQAAQAAAQAAQTAAAQAASLPAITLSNAIPPAAAPPVAPAALPAPRVALPAPASAAPSSQPVAGAAPMPASGSRPGRKSAAAAKPVQMETASLPQPQHRDAPQELQTLSEITISGIAWQEERRLRRAVLNGALVGEGAEVAGARVVEIRENKVRMSRGGQLYEVVFSSGQAYR